MLLEFTFSNHRSFRDEAALSLIATSLKSRTKQVDLDNLFVFEKSKILRSSAIYGANASGKSNIASAMRCMKHLIAQSVQIAEDDGSFSRQPFALDVESPKAPSTFEAVFVAGNRQYRYGFSVSDDAV